MSSRPFGTQAVATIILIAFCIYSTDAIVEITAPKEVAGQQWQAPELIWLPNKFNISGPVVLYDDLNTTECETPELYDLCKAKVNNSIVFFTAFGKGINAWEGVSFEDCFVRPLLWGARGVVYANNVLELYPGNGEVLIDSRETTYKFTNMPVFEMGYRDGEIVRQILQSTNETVYFHVSIGDHNPWREIRRGPAMIVWQVITTIWAGIVSAIALYKLIAYVREQGIVIGVAQVSLAVETACNMLRMVYCAIDPVYGGKYFMAPAAHILFSITWPVGLINTLLISMYWQQLVDNARVKIYPFLHKMKIPFIILTIVIATLEFATSGARASHLSGKLVILTTVNGAIYVICDVALLLFFCIAGGKVIKQLQQGSKISGSKRLLRKTTIFVITSMIFSLFFVAGLGMGAISSIFFQPVPNLVSYSLAWFGMLGGSLSQVLSIKTPTRKPYFTRSTSASGLPSSPSSRAMSSHSRTASTSHMDSL